MAQQLSRPVSRVVLESLADQIRRIIIEESKQANVGHIGSSLSVADIVAAIYGGLLGRAAPDDPNRDRFILSKGHAALSLYAALSLTGRIDAATLSSFCRDGTLLAAHPEHGLRGVEFSTGSLGHGLPIGAGAAIAARMQGSSRRIFVLVSDAECNEGSLWEAVMFAAHHRLSSLIVIVDRNGQQGLGYTNDVLSLSPLAERWRGFGWDAHEVDGHDPFALVRTIEHLETQVGPPHVLVAKTTFGRGISFMESQINWHYAPMTDEEYAIALAELDGNVP